MEKCEFNHQSLSLPYYVRGTNSGLLLLSGAHGDEFEVIGSVHKSVVALDAKLPDFLYIPEVSPSSVASRTRSNYRGKDINRQFVKNTECEEAHAVMELLRQFHMDTCVSFHEDPELAQFYMYDSGKFSDSERFRMQDAVRSCGVELFSGVDDPEDEYLGFEFVDGYRPHTGSDGKPEGPLETWLIRQKIVKRVFGVEVPGKADSKKKDALVLCLLKLLAGIDG